MKLPPLAYSISRAFLETERMHRDLLLDFAEPVVARIGQNGKHRQQRIDLDQAVLEKGLRVPASSRASPSTRGRACDAALRRISARSSVIGFLDRVARNVLVGGARLEASPACLENLRASVPPSS